MAKFDRKGKKEGQAINTAALPDIVFMLLFFFMVATVLREVEYKIKLKLPEASEIKKLEKKSLVTYIYVGEPKLQYQKLHGTEPKIQLNDAFARVSDIQDYIIGDRQTKNEDEVPFMTTSLKVDMDTKMGIVTQIKQELRKVSALKINYSSRKKVTVK